MRIAALFLVLLMSACSIVPGRLERARESVKDKPAAYQAGYMEGCESALTELEAVWGNEAKWRRDDARMKSDGDYALGWNDGRWKCKPY